VRAGYNPDKFENIYQILSDRYPASQSDRVPLKSRAMTARQLAAKSEQKWRKPTVADRGTFASLKKQAGELKDGGLTGGDGFLFLRAFPNCVLSADTAD